MLENEFNISKLIAEHLPKPDTTEQDAQLKNWLERSPDNAELFNELNDREKIEREIQFYTSGDKNAIWNRLMTKIHPDQQELPAQVRIAFWRPLLAIASVVLIISASLLLWKTWNKTIGTKDTQQIVKIAPGINGATLTLANGRKIALSTFPPGELANEGEIKVTKAKDGRLIYVVKGSPDDANSSGDKKLYNTLSTAKGQTFQVQLPDGTMVWLNAASSITFPLVFERNKRKVNLSGEAYFEVKKQLVSGKTATRVPFSVSSPSGLVEVLGTHFNISGYPGEPEAKVTLLEGSVSVSKGKMKKTIVPGEQAVIRGSGIAKESIDVRKVNAIEAIDWKNGKFIFNGERLESILNKLSRWYNVQIIYYDASLKEELFAGTISKYSNAEEVLEMLELTGTVRFKVELNGKNERRIVVMQ